MVKSTDGYIMGVGGGGWGWGDSLELGDTCRCCSPRLVQTTYACTRTYTIPYRNDTTHLCVSYIPTCVNRWKPRCIGLGPKAVYVLTITYILHNDVRTYMPYARLTRTSICLHGGDK